MKEILLVQGKVALIDDVDYELVNKYKWCAAKYGNNYYVIAHIYKNKIRTTLRMHRLIMSAECNQEVDHKDSNGLNNQKNNLRLCTRQQNRFNSKADKNSSSKYKGVGWSKRDKKWQSYIAVNRKQKHLGYFNTETEAAKAYDNAATKYFGEFARTNF